MRKIFYIVIIMSVLCRTIMADEEISRIARINERPEEALSMILLINPPLVKPSEPPPGIARLYGTLIAAGVKCSIIDANIEGILHLLGKSPADSDRWTRRAVRNRAANLDFVRSVRGYCDLQRYKRAVSDLNRLIGKSAESGGPVRLSLCNYQDTELSAVRATDLFRAAEEYEKNPFHEYFSKRISVRHGTSLAGCGRRFPELPEPGADGVFDYRFYQGAIRTCSDRARRRLITSWVRRPGWENPFPGLVDQIVDGPGEQALLDLAGVHKSNRRRAFFIRSVSDVRLLCARPDSPLQRILRMLLEPLCVLSGKSGRGPLRAGITRSRGPGRKTIVLRASTRR